MAELIGTFLVVCGVTAFVTSSLKEDEDLSLLKSTGRMFGVLAGGIAGFAVVIAAITVLAG